MSLHHSIAITVCNTFLDSAERYVIEVRNKQIDRGVTFYDILASEGNKLASYMQNESIARVLKTGNYKKEFPLWANIIESQYEKGMERRILLDKTAEAMGIQHPDLETIPELPLPVGDKIASFLANVDLENFCKSANQRSC
ncbi:hypothetical protein [Wolbachia endosymbiont (group A) of Acrocera orbiculus]|uniref:hypothetical protein n=1 Tax=Wolbachia endosymbiont (group A) of Acrocera orbiculus TaxID=2953971 RepID=UPI002226A5AD|nr:hypothetical protein [Wolbachia endosymbiont (group A) of Acrocera orbiculus]